LCVQINVQRIAFAGVALGKQGVDGGFVQHDGQQAVFETVVIK
jgi:hypothetical protein